MEPWAEMGTINMIKASKTAETTADGPNAPWWAKDVLSFRKLPVGELLEIYTSDAYTRL